VAGAELACGAAGAIGGLEMDCGTVRRGAAGATGPALGAAVCAGLGATAGAGGALRAGALGAAAVGAAAAGSSSGWPASFLRTFSATSTGMELEWVFFSVTP
jgi:hypothetical protein